MTTAVVLISPSDAIAFLQVCGEWTQLLYHSDTYHMDSQRNLLEQTDVANGGGLVLLLLLPPRLLTFMPKPHVCFAVVEICAAETGGGDLDEDLVFYEIAFRGSRFADFAIFVALEHGERDHCGWWWWCWSDREEGSRSTRKKKMKRRRSSSSSRTTTTRLLKHLHHQRGVHVVRYD